MASADVQLIDRIRLQKYVPRADSFEVCSSPIFFIAHTKYLKAQGSSNHQYIQLLIASQLSNRLKHSDVRQSADLETEEGRKSGIVSGIIIFPYM